jgi:peptidyl-prolyl cis-trans isomerase C
MRHPVRLGLAALTCAASIAPCALAQAPPAGRSANPPAAGANPAAGRPDAVAATVNGEPIKMREVAGVIGRLQVPAGNEKEAYEGAVDLLVNTHLLTQFLKTTGITVTPAQVDQELAVQERQLKANKSDLATALAESGTTLDELRDRIARNLQWKNYVIKLATDAELKKYVQKNRDVFDNVQVRASHILLKVEPDASASDKEKARQRLAEIKKEIESGKISFADAANKYSQDDGNVTTPSGGDLGYFPRRGVYIEPFAAAAFALEKGKISDPIETEYGWHLIQVTDRREGKPIDFQQNRDAILNEFAADTQSTIVAEQRKTAKIDVKPMPPDLFPKAPPAPTTGTDATGGAAPKATSAGGAAPKATAPK